MHSTMVRDVRGSSIVDPESEHPGYFAILLCMSPCLDLTHVALSLSSRKGRWAECGDRKLQSRSGHEQQEHLL